MNILGESIKIIRKSKKLTQAQLAELTGFKQNTISNHENGKRQLDERDIRIYARALGVEPQELFDLSSSSENKSVLIDNHQEIESISSTLQQIADTSSQLEYERQLIVLDTAKQQLDEQNTVQEEPVEYDSDKIIPLYKQYEEDDYEEVLIYGEPSAGKGTWLSDESIESIMYPKPVPDHDIALRVRGNSMEPLFQDGEIVFVRKTKNVNNGQIIIIIVNNEAYIKKLYKKSREVKLVSLNPEYDDIILTEYDDVEIVGTVIL